MINIKEREGKRVRIPYSVLMPFSFFLHPLFLDCQDYLASPPLPGIETAAAAWKLVG